MAEADIAIIDKKPFTAYCTGRTFTLAEMGVKGGVSNVDRGKLPDKSSQPDQLTRTKSG